MEHSAIPHTALSQLCKLIKQEKYFAINARILRTMQVIICDLLKRSEILQTNVSFIPRGHNILARSISMHKVFL